MILHERLYIPPSFRNKVGAVHHKSFSKYPVFTTLSLFLTMNKVCNISNKYLAPNKSA